MASCFSLALLLAFCLPTIGLAFSEDSPTDQRVLVLLDDLSLKHSHSLFFGALSDRGYTLDFKSARDSSIVLKKFGEYLYDAAIIFSPKTRSFGGSLELSDVLDFVDSGHDLIVAADADTSDLIWDLASECGVDIDETPGAVVVDHQHYAEVPERAPDHTLVVGTGLIDAPVFVGPTPLKGPVVFQGAGLYVNPASELVVPVLSGSAAAYSADPTVPLSKAPALRGSNVTLVAAMQARNNARVLISGSLALFSDRFFRLVVSPTGTSTTGTPPESPKTSAWVLPAGNEQFAVELSKWVFHERGHLKAVNLVHHKTGETGEPSVYRISDNLDFEVDIFEWAGKEWVPYAAEDVQVQFYMMSPYILKTLAHNAKGKFFTSFRVPDVYGVFQFKVSYSRLGYTTISLSKQIPVRPFRHDEFERFIPAAFPYYASSFSMMLGFFIFGFVFLYHK